MFITDPSYAGSESISLAKFGQMIRLSSMRAIHDRSVKLESWAGLIGIPIDRRPPPFARQALSPIRQWF